MDCTWTPRYNYDTGEEITTKQQGGGCCGLGENQKPMVWKPGYGCFETDEMCTLPALPLINQGQKLTIDDTGQNGPLKEENGNYFYCEQITSGLNYGMWQNIQTY
ncbi:hypothetical protein DRN73_02780 [Candidatus Pacearchaeota archaeon]|nr:MAG: hypothetical protein DRN73_02780 [Candidatus Pacearchaeota archaeon]